MRLRWIGTTQTMRHKLRGSEARLHDTRKGVSRWTTDATGTNVREGESKVTTQVHRHTCRAREALTGIFKPGRQRAHTPVPARRPRRRHRCEGTKAPEATERKTSRETETVTCGVTTQHALFTPSLVPTSASLLTLLDTQDVLEVPRGREREKKEDE